MLELFGLLGLPVLYATAISQTKIYKSTIQKKESITLQKKLLSQGLSGGILSDINQLYQKGTYLSSHQICHAIDKKDATDYLCCKDLGQKGFHSPDK